MSNSPEIMLVPRDPYYTVYVSGVEFKLSTAQITYDSPNLFTLSFLGDLEDASTRSLRIESDPGIFEIVVDCLKGYPVLPLDKEMLPNNMTLARAMRYLTRDVDYLGLIRFKEMLANSKSAVPRDMGIAGSKVELVKLLSSGLPAGTKWQESVRHAKLIDTSGNPVIVYARYCMLEFPPLTSEFEVNGRSVPSEYTQSVKGSRRTNPWSPMFILKSVRNREAGARPDLEGLHGSFCNGAVVILDGKETYADIEADAATNRSHSWLSIAPALIGPPVWAEELWFYLTQQPRRFPARLRWELKLLGMKATTLPRMLMDDRIAFESET